MVYERNFDLINRKFRELLFPTIAVSIAGNFAVLIDAFLISIILGSQYLAVVQCVEPLVLLICVIYWMIGLGGSIVCSIAKADFDDHRANEIFTISLVSVVSIGILVTISVLLFPDAYAQILCNSDSLRPYVIQYLQLFIISTPFLCYLACVAYFVKSYGFIKLQFWAFLLCNVSNLICDVIFMKYLNLGIPGAALASTVGFILAAIFISSYFFSPKKSIRLIKVKSSIVLNYLMEICKSGFSSASVYLYQSIRLIFINSLLTVMIGTVGLEAFNMCSNILFVVMIFILGTVHSIIPIVSVYYKEEDYRGVGYVCNKALKLVLGFGLFFSLIFIIFPQISLYMFNVQNPQSIPVVVNSVRLFSFCFIGYAVNNLYLFYAQSAQFTKLSNAVSCMEGLIFPIFFAYLLSYFWGVDGIWIGFTVSEVLTIAIVFIYSRYVAKKTNNELSGFFLNRHNDDKSIFEYTINGNIEDAVNLSRKVQETLSYSKLSTMVSLAIEEMLVNIIEINDDVDLIDVMIRDKKDSMVISVKYSGILYNPLDDNDLDKISLLSKIANNVEYSQILEINNTEITLCHNDL